MVAIIIIRITISHKDVLTTGKGAKHRLEGSKWVPYIESVNSCRVSLGDSGS